MNPVMLLLNQLQNQLKAKNPQLFQQFQNLAENQKNPQEILNNMTNKYTPDQIKKFQKFANGFGITNEELSKYGINAKE